MEVLKTFLKNFIREMNVDRLMREIMKDERLKSYFIELNQEQLYEQGADSKGHQLEPYTFATMNIKRKKGQRYDRTTLKDTGKFYKSFRIVVQSDGFIIQADGQKEEMNLFDRYGIDILGLNEVNMYQFQQILAREIRTKIIQAISIN
jgi:hypothetical protein